METSTHSSFGHKALAVGSSVGVGLALLAAVAAYLAAASVAGQLAPESLYRVLGRTGLRVYSHPILLALLGLLCANILLATLVRVGRDGPRLGAQLCHWGVLVLAAGSCWYWLGGVKGDCVSVRTMTGPQQSRWSPMDKFFVEESFEVYARQGEQAVGRPLAGLADARRKALDVSFAGPGGVQVRVLGYMQSAALRDVWSDDSPAAVEAVEVAVRHEGQERRFVLSPQYEENRVADLGEFMVMYQPQASAEALNDLMSQEFPRMAHKATMLLIAGGAEGKLELLVLPSEGKRQRLELRLGQAAKTEVGDGTAELTVTRQFGHAQRRLEAAEAKADEMRWAAPAAEVELAKGAWRYRTYLPFASYPETAPWQEVALPGGGALELAFSREARPLPAEVRITREEFQTYGGSVVPKDYICEVEFEQGGRKVSRELSLNHPLRIGPYQLSQSSWRPSGERPEQIVLGVASRPGVWLAYAGMAMIVAGFLWAFYVKPAWLRRRGGAAVMLCAAAMLAGAQAAGAGEPFDAPTTAFLRQVDAGRVARLAVQADGRVTVLDTLAREELSSMSGRDEIGGAAPSAAYLELYFNSGAYLDADVIFVKEKQLRAALATAMPEDERAALDRTHRLPPASLLNMEACGLLLETGRATMGDFRRSARAVVSLQDRLDELGQQGSYRVGLDNLMTRYMAFLGVDALRMQPRRGGQWDAVALSGQGEGAAGAASRPESRPESQAAGAVAAKLNELARAWRGRDAAAVNRLAAELGAEIAAEAQVEGQALPSERMAEAELLYNRTYKATAAWVGFAAATLVWIAAAAWGSSRLRRLGLAILALSTAALAAGFAARWALSGRAWYLPPIMNQFEAVVGSALLAAAVGLALELRGRRTYYGLAASLYATVALLAGFLLPEQMGAGIKAAAGILSSPVMAVHVAVIIVGHALVGMTFFISAAYLLTRAARRPAFDEDGSPAGTLASIDRCNVIVVQMATWTVVLGTFLGAYWADFAWGRWWGWDVKEVWAMITALALVGILHARQVTPPRWRGAVTAILCILGTALMLFNWVGVNYFLRGLHSYA